MDKKILKFLILFISLSYISSIIIIPFQSYNPLISKNLTLLELIKNSSEKSIVDTLSHNLI